MYAGTAAEHANVPPMLRSLSDDGAKVPAVQGTPLQLGGMLIRDRSGVVSVLELPGSSSKVLLHGGTALSINGADCPYNTAPLACV